jgi:tetratricopeptide (TPR) repeat protein
MKAAPQLTDKLRRANALHAAGQLHAARALYQEILRLRPRHFDALHLLGVLAAQDNDPQQAVRLIEKAIQVEPNNAAAHCNKGTALQAINQWEAALAAYDRAIALRPDYAMAHCNRGGVLRELKQFAGALASCDRSIAIRADSAEAHSNRGNVLADLGRTDEALHSYERAIALRGNYAEAYFNRGNLLKALGRFAEALASYDIAIAIRPAYAEAHANRGAVLFELREWHAALAAYDRAIAAKHDYAEGHLNRGNVLKAAGRFNEALESYKCAIATRADYVEAYCNLGFVLKELRQHRAALERYERALLIRPDFAEASFNRGTLLLSLGDFERGWHDYESRWKLEHTTAPVSRNFSQPLWRGEQPIAGKTLLLHSEQGLGDTLQFCRYAKLVAELGAHVVCEVQPQLVQLLATLAGPSQVIAAGGALPEFDYHCPLLSLPLAFRTDLASIPATARYLAAEPIKVAQWQARLGEQLRPRIGLTWSGSSRHTNDHNRNIPLAELLARLPRGLDYVSLQYEPRADDQRTLEANPWIVDLTDGLRDFADSAALTECLDLVVGVDTSVAHLSGALGKPTCILLPSNPDWRWLLDRSDSPWYPTLRLLRQQSSGEWTMALEQLNSELTRLR